MKPLHQDRQENITDLRNSLRDHGYVFIKNFFKADFIEDLASRVNSILIDRGWGLQSDSRIKSLTNAHRLGSEEYCLCIAEIMGIAELHDLPHKSGLTKFIGNLLNCCAFLHPRKIVRISYPYSINSHDLVTPHQDICYVKGEIDTLVAWIPLANYDTQSGPLKVAHASHKLGLLPTNANSEGRFGCTAANLDNYAIDWRTNDYEKGDLLIMHSMLVHASLPNNTDKFRITFDCRFSDSTKSINAEQLLPPYYPRIKPWDKIAPQIASLTQIPESITVEPAETSLEHIMQKKSVFL